MKKIIVGFAVGTVLFAVVAWNMAGGLMFVERASPFGMDETIARIQHNILNSGTGWTLTGLRNPARAVQSDGGNVLPVIMVEACSTRYSGPILKDDSVRFLSILMPCKIAVYKKNDGKVYIANMNAGLMGKMFGPLVGDIMVKVAEDQQKFIVMDPSQPAPQMIVPKPAGEGGGGLAGGSGC